METVKYLVIHGAEIFIKDARGNNALDDAIREKRQKVVDYLMSVLERARLWIQPKILSKKSILLIIIDI